MGAASGVDARLSRAAATALVLILSACGQAPIKPSPTHIRAEQPAPEGAIPAPVQVAPVLPPPSPTQRAETYTVVVNNVRVQDLLFALARDAKLNVDISPGVQGSVTLNAIDQTLPQILSRIAKQVDMRYEIDGPTLSVMRDSPYLRVYRVDYVNLARDTTNQANLSTQVSGTSTSGGTGGGAAVNNSTSVVKTTSVNKFWDTLVNNIKDILRETDKVIPLGPQGATPASPAPPAAAAASGTAPVQQVVVAQPQMEFREAASVIANAEAGVLTIRATSRQHEKVQEFLDQVLASATRQVLIEATIAEVQLNNQYQRGIDWSRLRNSAGFNFTQSPAGPPATPAGITTNAFIASFTAPGFNLSATLRLLESFGDVRVLSSPKISVLNNQTATLKVVDNLVYFTIQAQTTTSQTTALTTFTTTVNSVPVGFLMAVVPQIGENDTVLLNIRPTISRKVDDVQDPNPALANPCGVGVVNCAIPKITSNIPVIQTREMESVMRVQSGQTAVLGGLIQDAVTNIEDTIPGINRIPGIGQALEQKKNLNQKTELVIFLRPVVIRDTSLQGDYARYRELVPGNDFFQKPNPSRVPPAE